MANKTSDIAVELWNNQIAGLLVSVHNQLSNQELGVSALRQFLVGALQLVRDQLALLEVTVLESGLDDSDGVVLEDEIANAVGDDLEQFLDQLLSLLQGDVGLATQLLPKLLGPGDGVGIGLGGLALLLERLLLDVRLAGVV